jgi:putative glycosyltransferase (TIGR04348 family)
VRDIILQGPAFCAANAAPVPPAKTALRIGIVAPRAETCRAGNAHTARRYAQFFRSAGHRVTLAEKWSGEPFDLLIALHAKKSGPSVLAFRKAYPERPIALVLTGTDLYRDLERSRAGQQSIHAASALVTLQEDGIRHLPAGIRRKAVTIVQSAESAKRTRRVRKNGEPLHVCVLGHLRYVKDPLRIAYALRALPPQTAILVTQAGAAIEKRYAVAARKLERQDSRYRWLGDLPHGRALKLLANSDLFALPSRTEGGANTISEAIAAGVPVIASRISGNIGLLGDDYAGLFSVGSTAECAALMRWCATDSAFLALLRRRVRALQPLVRPARERRLWLQLIQRLLRTKRRSA